MEKLVVDINHPVINLVGFRIACENLPVGPSNTNVNFLLLGNCVLIGLIGINVTEIPSSLAIWSYSLLAVFFIWLIISFSKESKKTKAISSPVEFCGAPLFQTRNVLTELCSPLPKMGIQALQEKPNQKVKAYLQVIEPLRTLVLLDEMVIDHYLAQE